MGILMLQFSLVPCFLLGFLLVQKGFLEHLKVKNTRKYLFRKGNAYFSDRS